MSPSSSRILPSNWNPVGVEQLEPNALDIVHSDSHRSVIAGPGSGKTELLAQRASYLLQTGLSPFPRRILAISFKTDAATNLAGRVRERCHPNDANRFDSLTFDAFAKSLLDRFGQILPTIWRPRPKYEILLTNFRLYERFLNTLGPPPTAIGIRADIEALTVKAFERTHLLGAPLANDPPTNMTPPQWAANRFWTIALHEQSLTYLSFPMIGRLVELLLRLNPVIRRAVGLTYSHLFMDEFQDTTQVQYDLVRTIFSTSDTQITAVGDNKQKIMRWALAMDEPFSAIEIDFGAIRSSLLNNYRSSPDLVRIQHVLAQALDARAVEPVSKAIATVSGDSCALWEFSSVSQEADRLAGFIEAEMKKDGLSPRDFVILVRQLPANYSQVLEPAFSKHGLSLRNEAARIGSLSLQDLLSEKLSKVLVSLFRLAISSRAGHHWTTCQATLSSLRGISPHDERAQRRLACELDEFAKNLRGVCLRPVRDEAEARSVIDITIAFVGRQALSTAHPAYRQGEWLDKVVESMVTHLAASSSGVNTWQEALDTYEGFRAVPLMTIHKSKGHEYHTVIFVGLDDGAWWSFEEDEIEGTSGFFVAFTRAKQRVMFTYCAKRGARVKVATLYHLLEKANVDITTH